MRVGVGTAALVLAMGGCRLGYDSLSSGDAAVPTDAPGAPVDGGATFDGAIAADAAAGDDPVVIVPGGDTTSFMMGCNAALDSSCDGDESPYHPVTLSGYAIQRTEVTQAAYGACEQAGSCPAPPGCMGAPYDPVGLADYPVTCITWEAAVAYCELIGMRLPTEAEWELAARGTDGRVFPWGNTGAATCDLANMTLCGDGVAHPVGSHPTGASPFGLQDMGGNAWEWVADWYDNAYYDTSPVLDPAGPASGSARVERGGGWFDPSPDLRTSSRRRATGTVNPDLGFRCAVSL